MWKRLRLQLRYARALLRQFKVTIAAALVLFGVMPLVFWWLYEEPPGHVVSYGEALHHVYFLIYGQPSLPYDDHVLLEALNFLIPPLSIAILVDGAVRFMYMFFAKHHHDKEWIEVLSQSMTDHVVICGAGRVGYRVAEQLLRIKREVLIVEKREDASFIGVLRDLEVPVLIDDVKSPQALERTNIQRAAAIVCATDDDLTNLNVALDARRLNPAIRVVIRLFDDELVSKVRESFQAEALSTSALAAPAMALAALDPRIVHSFHIGGHLMVVSEFVAKEGLPGLTVAQVRDDFGGLTLSIRSPGGPERLHPKGETPIQAGEVLTVQAEYADYQRLRAHAQEAQAPLSHLR